jgi:hypothetical protein
MAQPALPRLLRKAAKNKRARHIIEPVQVYSNFLRYFLGRDSGGTNPDNR